MAFLKVNIPVRLLSFGGQILREAFSLPLATMCKRNWRLAPILIFLVLAEFILPVSVRAQSFADTGAFYFTGSHAIRRFSIFREIMPGFGKPGEELKVGPVRLHPFLGVAEVYTDNVFRRDTNRRSDFLTTIAPGVQALLPFGGGRHSFLVDYRAAQFIYKKFNKNNALAQDVVGHVSLNFASGLQVDLQGDHVEGFDPRGSEVDTQQQDITKWETNGFLGQVSYNGPGAGISLRTSYLDLHYKNNGQAPRRDRTRLRADLNLIANVTKSTSALLGFQVSDYTYDKNKRLDNFSYAGYTGFNLAPSRVLSGNFNIGYVVLNYDRAPLEQPPPSGLSAGTKQVKSLFMRGNLQWNPTSRLSISATPFRFISQSAVFGTDTFIQTGVFINARQLLTERVGLRASLSYVNDDFNNDRQDNRFLWRMGPEYRTVKWLGFRLDYIFEKRGSTDSNFNYYSNTIMLTIQGFL